MSDTYAVYCAQVINKPWWIGDPDAEAWQGVMGAMLDDQLDRLEQARAVRYPTVPTGGTYACPTDALYYLAAERGLERVPGESEDAWRERLRDAWNIWRESGSADGHTHEFGWSNLHNAVVMQRERLSTPPSVGSAYVRAFASQVWAQFDILIQQPHPWVERTWGSGTWGSGTWGSSMTEVEADYFRRQLRDHSSGHSTCTYMHVSFTQERIWGPNNWGDGGTWGGNGHCMTVVVGEDHWRTLGRL